MPDNKFQKVVLSNGVYEKKASQVDAENMLRNDNSLRFVIRSDKKDKNIFSICFRRQSATGKASQGNFDHHEFRLIKGKQGETVRYLCPQDKRMQETEFSMTLQALLIDYGNDYFTMPPRYTKLYHDSPIENGCYMNCTQNEVREFLNSENISGINFVLSPDERHPEDSLWLTYIDSLNNIMRWPFILVNGNLHDLDPMKRTFGNASYAIPDFLRWCHETVSMAQIDGPGSDTTYDPSDVTSHYSELTPRSDLGADPVYVSLPKTAGMQILDKFPKLNYLKSQNIIDIESYLHGNNLFYTICEDRNDQHIFHVSYMDYDNRLNKRVVGKCFRYNPENEEITLYDPKTHQDVVGCKPYTNFDEFKMLFVDTIPEGVERKRRLIANSHQHSPRKQMPGTPSPPSAGTPRAPTFFAPSLHVQTTGPGPIKPLARPIPPPPKKPFPKYPLVTTKQNVEPPISTGANEDNAQRMFKFKELLKAADNAADKATDKSKNGPEVSGGGSGVKK